MAERLLLFREINWRLEAAMVPLFLHIIEPFETAINDAFAVLSTGKPLQTATTSSEIGIIGKPEEILDAWSNIAFGLMREARETYNESRWKSLDSQIEKITSQITRLNDRKCYERALWAIWNLKRDKANEELNRWQPSPHPAALIYRTRG